MLTKLIMLIGRFLGNLFPMTRKSRKMLSAYVSKEPTNVYQNHEVTLENGMEIVGFQQTPSSCVSFRGVPFANAKRLENPQVITKFEGPKKQCTSFGPACPQSPFGFRLFFESIFVFLIEYLFPPLPSGKSYYYGDMSEEYCLNANVYTPGVSSSEDLRPVLVWIHGGAFMLGSNTEAGMYDASSLSIEENVVVVSINYRLGPFGFMHFPGQGITNLGIRDQIAGLEWVRQNVSKFGGDPSNVTIIGESAGGMSIGTLLGCPRAKGLFHRAVPLSGACTRWHSEKQWEHVYGLIEPQLQSLTRRGGKKTVYPALTPKEFQSIPASKLVELVSRDLFSSKPIQIQKLGNNTMLWQPIEDGEIVPMGGSHAGIANNSIPILAGVTDNEAMMFEFFEPKGKTKEQVIEKTVVQLRAAFKRTTKDEGDDPTKWKRHAKELYEIVESCRHKRGLPTTPNDIKMAITNITWFEDAHYCLARDGGPNAFSFNLQYKDSAHGCDIELLFGFASFGGGEPMTGGVGKIGKPKPDDWERSKQFRSMIASFARTGVPTVENTSSSSKGDAAVGDQPVEWVQHSETMNLLHSGRPVSMPFKEEILKFQALKEQIKKDLKI